MSKPVSRLGKGLSAIIGPRDGSQLGGPASTPAPDEDGLARAIPIDRIRPNQHQPRSRFDETSLAELTRSIEAKGVLQPIVVRPTNDGQYELVAGERRWKAARAAGLQSIPATIRLVTDAESLELALIENLQREDLGPLERATGYQQYLDTFSVTAEELAQRLSESRANISNYLRLLRLQPDIRKMIDTRELGMGQARAIAGVAQSERQLALARLAIRRNLSVRQVETLARDQTSTPAHKSREIHPAARHIENVATTLSHSLGLKVRLFSGKKKNSGRVVIHYNSLEDFDRIAQRIGGRATLEE
ncbi:MAG: ParB/RepB/Spo0J family partition protein [Planctomycetes bacterium]|nr:ParB/RepB/Spo0J family partition protein [Planctomycetota bacterium]